MVAKGVSAYLRGVRRWGRPSSDGPGRSHLTHSVWFSESQPIPIWIEEMNLTPPRLHHDLTIELTSYCVQVADPQIDEAVGVGVTTVL